MKVISSSKAPSAIGPYSQAIISGELVYTSGVIPASPETGEIIGETAQDQAEQAFSNLSGLLEDAGSSIGKVIKTTVFIKNMNDFAKINEVYARYFKEPYPARSCVEVARLPKDVLIEIEAVAETGD